MDLPADALLRAGILAASADNALSLRFSRNGNALLLWPTSDFGSAPPHRKLLMLWSYGGVVENMAIRASRLGLSSRVTWHLDRDPTLPIGEIEFSDVSAQPSGLDSAIEARHTNRAVVFRGPRLTAAQQEQMAADVRSFPGLRLTWLDARPLRKASLRLVREAEAARFRVRGLHKELFDSIRFDAGWESVTDEGIAPGALGVERPLRPLFAMLRNWRAMQLARGLGGAYLLGIRAAWLPCRLAPHVCALSTTLEPAAGAIAAGRALQRLWLRATTFGLALQPLGAAAILTWEEHPDVPRRVRASLTEQWNALCPGERPMIVFRMGHARAPRVRSGRGPVERYWRQSGQV